MRRAALQPRTRWVRSTPQSGASGRLRGAELRQHNERIEDASQPRTPGHSLGVEDTLASFKALACPGFLRTPNAGDFLRGVRPAPRRGVARHHEKRDPHSRPRMTEAGPAKGCFVRFPPELTVGYQKHKNRHGMPSPGGSGGRYRGSAETGQVRFERLFWTGVAGELKPTQFEERPVPKIAGATRIMMSRLGN